MFSVFVGFWGFLVTLAFLGFLGVTLVWNHVYMPRILKEPTKIWEGPFHSLTRFVQNGRFSVSVFTPKMPKVKISHVCVHMSVVELFCPQTRHSPTKIAWFELGNELVAQHVAHSHSCSFASFQWPVCRLTLLEFWCFLCLWDFEDS